MKKVTFMCYSPLVEGLHVNVQFYPDEISEDQVQKDLEEWVLGQCAPRYFIEENVKS